jgi:DNA-binding protein WhiA
MSFTARVREELAHLPEGPRCCRVAETTAVVRLAGALHLSDRGASWVVDLGDGAVARRTRSALSEVFGIKPEVEVHRRTALQGQRYRLTVPAPANAQLVDLGLLDDAGRPVEAPPADVAATPHDAAAFVRGALMAAGSISDPRRSPHLEIRAPNAACAQLLQALLVRCGAPTAGAAQRDDGWRVALKSGAAIGAVLARVGAHTAFLAWPTSAARRPPPPARSRPSSRSLPARGGTRWAMTCVPPRWPAWRTRRPPWPIWAPCTIHRSARRRSTAG